MAENSANNAGGYLNNQYEWFHDGQVKTPFLKSLDSEFYPSASWIGDFVGANAIIGVQKVVEVATELFTDVLTWGETADEEADQEPDVRTIEDYFDSLVDDREDVPTCRDVDLERKIIISDKAFAQYRLSGPNPLSIRLATDHDLDTLVPELRNDTVVTKLAKKKHLFIVDYSSFASLKVGRSFVEGFSKAALGSVALFKQQDKGLVPVCVRVISSTGKSKLFRPDGPRGPKHNGFGWEIAKCVFNSNDCYHNQSLMHYARAHLVAEIFLVATYRSFRTDHPLYKLLTPHVEGTAFINDMSESSLINDEGTFDVLLSFDIDDTRQIVKSFIESFTASDMRFPARLKARQMDVDSVPGLDYPYRDDGLLVWEAIRRWVANYVQIFYPNDDAVAADTSVRNWIEELKTNGGVRWLDNFEYTVDWLSDVIASFITLTSLDHASVNYTQRDYLQFTPAFPMSIYAGDSVVFKEKPTERDYLALLPPKTLARKQATINYAFSSFVYSRLGHYDSQVAWYSCSDYFSEVTGDDGLVIPDDYLDRVNEALTKFQEDLDHISEEIQQLNESRETPYTALLPENLPQSINL